MANELTQAFKIAADVHDESSTHIHATLYAPVLEEFCLEASREDEGRNWYIEVTNESGYHTYDGYWRDSERKSCDEVLAEAADGSLLHELKSPPEGSRPITPLAATPAAPGEVTDAQLLDLADDFKSTYQHGGTTFDDFDSTGFARAVLALSSPAPVAAPAPASEAVADARLLKAFGRRTALEIGDHALPYMLGPKWDHQSCQGEHNEWLCLRFNSIEERDEFKHAAKVWENVTRDRNEAACQACGDSGVVTDTEGQKWPCYQRCATPTPGDSADAPVQQAEALLTEFEQRAVLADPMGLECLINYHDCQEAGADAMEPGAGQGNARRALQLLALGREIIARDPEIWDDAQKRAFALRHSERAALKGEQPEPSGSERGNAA